MLAFGASGLRATGEAPRVQAGSTVPSDATCPCATRCLRMTYDEYTPGFLITARFRGLQKAAHSAVTLAVLRGDLPPAKNLTCSLCLKQAFDYDHRDYRRPLEVTPVCRKCNLNLPTALPWHPSGWYGIETLPNFHTLRLATIRGPIRLVRQLKPCGWCKKDFSHGGRYCGASCRNKAWIYEHPRVPVEIAEAIKALGA